MGRATRIRKLNLSVWHRNFTDARRRSLLGAAIQGVGLAELSGPLAEAAITAGQSQALLERFAITTPGVFLCHPGGRQVLPKLRAFIEQVRGGR